MNLNQKQLDLLKHLAVCPSSGAVVYGRGPTATVNALAQRRLCAAIGTINVIVMDKMERRTIWGITSDGIEAAIHGVAQEVRS